MISVIVPIYNIEKYLPVCIESIRSQTYKDLEIILVDDGSTDTSPLICDEYAQKDRRIVVLHKENGGLVSARKAGLRMAHGDYIGYVDGDDWIEKDMYKTLHHHITSTDADIVICGHYNDMDKWQPMDIREGYYDQTDMEKEIYPHMIINGEFFEWGIFPGVWDKLYKKELIESVQYGVDERITMGEDAACVYPCLLQAESIYVTHEHFYHYRQNAASMIRQIPDRETECERMLVLYRSVLERMSGYPAVYHLERQWMFYMLFLMIPRADNLYKGIDQLDYLFPFPQVQKGARIVLYGAGTYGRRLWRYLQVSHFCNVVLWVDRNWKELAEQGFEVYAQDEIDLHDFDYIVIAIMGYKARKAAYENLSEMYGEDRTVMLDTKTIIADDAMEALGLF